VGSRIRRIWPGGDPALSQTLGRVVRLRHPLGVVSEREPSVPSTLTFTRSYTTRVAFSGTHNGFPLHLQLRLSDRLFSNQVRTWYMEGVASRAIQGSALPSPPPLSPSSPSASSSSSSSSSSSKTTVSPPTTIARLSSPSSSATFTKRSLGA
jgi:hypothetical protein